MTLYEIREAIRNFEFDFDEESGEILNANEYDALQIAETEKKEAIGCLIKEGRAEVAALIAEMKSLKDRADRKQNWINNMEKWYAQVLGNEAFETPRVQVSFRKSQTTDIIEERLIPSEYMVQRIKTETKPDKDKIKKAINAGKEVPGAVLTDHYNIQVK